MASPIRPDDTGLDRVSKLLPADVTAAFISAREALGAYYGQEHRAVPVVLAFAVILALCPFYFRHYSRITDTAHIAFLCLGFVVFALGLASVDFGNLFQAWKQEIKGISIALPIIWAYIISNIFAGWLGSRER
jgi:hypothetical protein